MKRNLLKVGSLVALAAVFAFGVSSTAEAGVKLRLTQGMTVVTVSDDVNDGLGGLPDDIAVGDPDTIAFFGPVGVFNLNVTTGIVTPDTVLPEVMHLNSIDTSLVAGTLKIEFTATGLDLDTVNMYLALGPLVAPGGSITYSAYWDDGNGGNNEFSTVNQLIGTLNGAGTTVGPGPGNPSGLYSLTQVVTITHGAGGGTTSFDANITIPEPASMSLLGLGLAGIAAFRRRRAAR